MVSIIMPTVSKNKFNGGIADDVREEVTNKVAHASHFDIWSNPFRVTPFRSMSTADAGAGSNIRNFIMSSIGLVFAVGIVPSTSRMRLFSSDWSSFTSWTTVASSATQTQVVGVAGGFNALIEYKDYIYGIHGINLNKIWRYGPLSSSPAYTEDYTAGGTIGNNYTRCGGMVIGSDDNLYILLSSSSRNDLIKITSAHAVSSAAIALPAINEYGTCAEIFGSYLAIGTVKPAETSVSNSLSKIYLWDYVSVDPTEKIICPDGGLVSLGNVDGNLFTITRLFRGGFGQTNTTLVGIVRGLVVDVFAILPNVIPTASRKQIYSGNMYFGGLHSSDYLKSGIYAIGRVNANYPWGVTMEFQAVSTGSTNPTAINGFYIVDDYMWISHSTDNVTKILNSATYLNTSVIETLINDSMVIEDRGKKKQLMAVRVLFPPLTSGQQIVLKYAIDTTTYTTIKTFSTVGETYFEAVKDTNGNTFDTGREFQFRIESTGGAEIIGIDYKYNVIKTLI